MRSIQIKGVPAATHAVLRRRAAQARQSLQEYLLARLIAEAASPSLEEVLDRAGGRAGGSVSLVQAVADPVGRGCLSQRPAGLALDDLREIPIQRAPHRQLLARCWELRDSLTPYDAAYVALAEALATVLIAGDGRLSRAPALRCRVEVVTSCCGHLRRVWPKPGLEDWAWSLAIRGSGPQRCAR